MKSFDNCDGTDIIILYGGESYSQCVNQTQCSNKVIVERTWNAIDNCGNTGYFTQRLVVFDDTAPTFNENWDIINPGVIKCSDVPFFRIPCRTASDNCGGSVTVSTNFYGSLTSPAGLIIDYIAEDSCGNTNVDRRIVTSDCSLTGGYGTFEPILASYEINPPKCRPLLQIPEIGRASCRERV